MSNGAVDRDALPGELATRFDEVPRINTRNRRRTFTITLTRTSPNPGVGMGTSSIFSGLPNSRTTAAFILFAMFKSPQEVTV